MCSHCSSTQRGIAESRQASHPRRGRLQKSRASKGTFTWLYPGVLWTTSIDARTREPIRDTGCGSAPVIRGRTGSAGGLPSAGRPRGKSTSCSPPRKGPYQVEIGAEGYVPVPVGRRLHGTARRHGRRGLVRDRDIRLSAGRHRARRDGHGLLRHGDLSEPAANFRARTARLQRAGDPHRVAAESRREFGRRSIIQSVDAADRGLAGPALDQPACRLDRSPAVEGAALVRTFSTADLISTNTDLVM